MNVNFSPKILLILVLVILDQKCAVSKSKNDTYNEMLRLKTFLLSDYDGLVRPVRDGKSPTILTFRMLIYALLDMDTLNQMFEITTWVKMRWTDEFLTWNASDFSGIDNIHFPSQRVWLPDITLHQNVDAFFERYKPTTYVHVQSNGSVEWLVPTIFTSSCRQRVRYFPFDTQVCEMRLSSWAYDGTHIELRTEDGVDTSQNRFLDNGVWTLISVKSEREVIYYSCCPTPYYELLFTLVFRRNSAFYVSYLVLPCVFLSALSLFVFMLPTHCGEKLTLSITNLLALIVFQQVIAETMPPTGDESPLIGTYFLTMIVMVCMSVVITVIVIEIGFKNTPMPRWVESIVLKRLGQIVFVDSSSVLTSDVSSLENKECACIVNKAATATENGVDHRNNADKIGLPGCVNTKAVTYCNKENNSYPPGDNTCKTPIGLTKKRPSDASDISEALRYIKHDIDAKSEKELLHAKWRLVAVTVDRLLLLIFAVFTVFVTTAMMTFLLVQSKEDFENARSENE